MTEFKDLRDEAINDTITQDKDEITLWPMTKKDSDMMIQDLWSEAMKIWMVASRIAKFLNPFMHVLD